MYISVTFDLTPVCVDDSRFLPTVTLTSSGCMPSTQWAAVKTYCDEINEPPQYGYEATVPPDRLRTTAQGHAISGATSPPTMGLACGLWLAISIQLESYSAPHAAKTRNIAADKSLENVFMVLFPWIPAVRQVSTL
jgi:hypothetical protein